LTTSLLLGSIPGVYLGARFSSSTPDGIIRRVLVFALMASGLKLLNVSTSNLGIILLAGLITGLHPRRHPRRRGDRPRPQHRLRVGRAGPG
jgi:uncharacterized protein